MRSWAFAGACIGALIGSLGAPPAAMGQESLQDITARLIAAAEQTAGADRSAAGPLAALARQRAPLFEALVERDPGLALQLALPKEVADRLPEGVRQSVEQHVELEGTLEVLVEDRHDGTHRMLYELSTGTERVSLHFAGEPPALLTGTRARARGVRAGNLLALDSGSSSLQTVTAVLANTIGEQHALVLLVNFQDNPNQPYTSSYAWNIVFGETHAFYFEGSFGQTSLSGDVAGWFTLPMSATVCDSTKIATLARQAATAAGINLSPYNRFVYAFPKNACGWWGLGNVGGNPSNAWVNGPLELRVVGHEIGHNFGLVHAASLDCGAEPLGPSCTANEYGDTTDIMGASAFQLQAFHKERLGWLNAGVSPPIETVQSSGTYFIAPYEYWTTSTKALRVLRSIDSNSGKPVWYYLEFRRSVGFDSAMQSGLTSGAVIHLASEAGGNRSYLIDTTSTDTFEDAALTVGRTFYDPYVGLRITISSATTSGLLITVAYEAAACQATRPSVTLTPATTTWVSAGTPVTYAVTITNNDGSSCAASTFNVVPVAPAGWTASTSAASVRLAPGASTTASAVIASNPATPAGSYDVGVTVVDAVAAASTTTTLVKQAILAALNVTVRSTSARYQRGDTVRLEATVTGGGTPVPNAAVTFFVTRPDGQTESIATVTNPYGTATYQWKVSRRDPIGVYTVSARASISGTSATAATSFSVD